MRVTTILLAICAAALLGILATVVAVAMRNADAEEAQAARDKEALELEKDRDRREQYDAVMKDARRFLGGSY